MIMWWVLRRLWIILINIQWKSFMVRCRWRMAFFPPFSLRWTSGRESIWWEICKDHMDCHWMRNNNYNNNCRRRRRHPWPKSGNTRSSILLKLILRLLSISTTTCMIIIMIIIINPTLLLPYSTNACPSMSTMAIVINLIHLWVLHSFPPPSRSLPPWCHLMSTTTKITIPTSVICLLMGLRIMIKVM